MPANPQVILATKDGKVVSAFSKSSIEVFTVDFAALAVESAKDGGNIEAILTSIPFQKIEKDLWAGLKNLEKEALLHLTGIVAWARSKTKTGAAAAADTVVAANLVPTTDAAPAAAQ